ncbi:MAG: PepSY domain-containing protein [Kordiimonadaceae bacterium]|nr:PepSY domain-containing protein [Kordiimonadaceae bacterium]
MKLLRKIHLYLGLILGIAFILTAISGTILVYRPEIISLSLDTKTPKYQKIEEEEAVKAIRELSGPDINFIDFPMADAPWYRVWNWNGSISYYDPVTLEKLPVNYNMTEIMIFLSDLHIHFLGGHMGEQILGYTGIVLIFMIISGLWIWWPFRRGFNFKEMIPLNLKRKSSLKSHRSFGFFNALVMFIVTLTGVALVFYAPSQKIVSTLLGEVVSQEDLDQRYEKALGTLPANVSIANLEDFTRYYFKYIPEGDLARFYMPKPETPTIARIRFRYPEGLSPFGASFLSADLEKQKIVRFEDYRHAPEYYHVSRTYYALHAGKTGGFIYKFLVALSGFALTLLCFTGFNVWYKTGNSRKNTKKE